MVWFFCEGYGDHRDLHGLTHFSLHDALPISEGPTRATISPPATLKEAPDSTSRRLRACLNTRRTPRSSRPWPLRLPTLLRSLLTAPLLITEGLHRIEPRGAPGGVERSQEGEDRKSTRLTSSH